MSRRELQSPSLATRPCERRSTLPKVENVESRCEMTMKVERLRLLRSRRRIVSSADGSRQEVPSSRIRTCIFLQNY